MPQERLGDAPRIFTIGYQGHSIDEFIDLLHREGIQAIADVRDNPWSRKPGFSKSGLEDHLEEAEVAYHHIGDLGLPKPIRDELRDGKREGFEQAYEDHLEENPDAIDRLAELARQAPTAMMCMEKNVEDCHRRYIAARFDEAGWDVIHV